MGKVFDFDILDILGFNRKRDHSDVLAWVNEERQKLGAAPLNKLPDGKPGSTYQCVLARAFAGPMSCGMEYYLNEQKTIRRVTVLHGNNVVHIYEPPHVVEFVNRFDAGKIPELIAA